MTNEKLIIRQAVSEDLDVLHHVCRKIYAENFGDHWNEGGLEWYLDAVYGRDVIRQDLVSPDVRYFLAYLDSVPVGFMKLHLSAAIGDDDPALSMEIEKLYFGQQFQRMGIGTSLIAIALDVGRNAGKRIAWLGVIDTNEKAIQFYKKMGFSLLDKTTLDVPYFKDELRGMWRMVRDVR